MRRVATFTTLLFLAVAFATGAEAADKLKALIIDGQNNHTAWPKTTVMMKKYLEDTVARLM